ncbi:MAG: organic solvent tolerance protein [Betaproteobacteria bacterium]|nr:organic solvent tolerance protein [Betaproteobacteria bacterium]
MHRIPKKRITFAVLCAMPMLATAAEDGIILKPQRSLLSLPAAREEPIPVFIEADTLEGQTDKEARAEGNVQLRRAGQSVFADRLTYDAQRQEADVSGNVRFEYQRDVLEGEHLRFNMGTERGFMEKPTFRFTPVPREPRGPAMPGSPALTTAPPLSSARPPEAPIESRGSAERVIFDGPDLYKLEKASYTTCGPGNDDWFIRSNELDIDKNRDLGVARGASIVFLDTPIFYTPYISFSLHQQRKSGLLTPHYGTATNTGTEITLPYYWNIAPNRDATLYPRIMTKRGLQLGGEFRYLDTNYRGEARLEIMPDDRVAGRERHGYFFKHAQTFNDGWTGAININRVSDDRYFTDLSTLVAVTSSTTLPNEGILARTGKWGDGTYTFSALAQQWQTLQTDPAAPITPPYNRMPQLSLTGSRQDLLKSDIDLLTSYVDFQHPTLTSGKRLLAYPSMSFPLQSSYAYLTPKIGVHASRYLVNNNTVGFEDTTRTLPIFTADSGLVFERDTRFTGLPFIQTLEPRLFYVYIPYRDQSRIPNFESGQQDVSFATIFSENQFSGNDRISDANQVTLGVTSRLIHPDSGIERLRVALAQRYYFSGQRVTLPGVAPRPDTTASSDLLAAVSGTILPRWTAEMGWQYSTDRSQTQKANIATRYQPAPGKVLNLAYRSTIDLIRQTDISFQWPVAANWTVVGRWNYSMLDKRTLEALAGFEYDGGCWTFRAVGHRFATALNAVSSSVFLQLELNGVSRIGSNPLDVLRRNVGGYTRPDPRSPGTDDYYVPGR